MSRRTIPPAVAYITSVIAFMTVMAAAGAPSALLLVYQQRWHFPDGELTFAFAIYALTLLLALLTVGSLSDHVGRRPVLVAALILQMAAMVMFLIGQDIGVIIGARALQGAATGAVTSAFSAYITEIAPANLKRSAALMVSIATAGGLGIGVALTGLAIQVTVEPATAVFGISLVLIILATAVLAASPETVIDRKRIGKALLPSFGVPAAARSSFRRFAPGLIGIWMSAGLILGLGASITHQALNITSGAVLGLIVAAQPLAATIVTLVLGPVIPPKPFMLSGYLAVIVGVALEICSFGWGSAPFILLGAIITGFGFGAVFSSILRLLLPLAEDHERAELFSAVYVVGYLAYSIPTIVAGFVADAIGLVPAAIIFATATLAVIVTALFSSRRSLLNQRKSADVRFPSCP